MGNKIQSSKNFDKKTDLEKETIRLLTITDDTEKYVQDYYKNHLYEKSPDETKNEVNELVSSIQRASANLVKAYITSSSLTDELKARWKDWKKSKKNKLPIDFPANGIIDIQEQNLYHFAKGLNFYKLIWILFSKFNFNTSFNFTGSRRGYINNFHNILIRTPWSS